MANLGTLTVKLSADASGVKQGVREAEGSLQGLATSAAKFAAGLAVFAGLTKLIKDSTAAYSDQVEAINKLNLALANQGNFTEKTSRSLQNYASQLQKTSIFADEVVLSAEAMLATTGMNEDQIIRTTKAAADFASITGRDLVGVVEVLGKAYQGNTAGLAKMNVVVDESIPKTERFDAALGQLEQRFGGMAEAQIQTLNGQLQLLKNSFGEVEEGIGKFVGFLANIGGSVQGTMAIFDRLAKFFSQDLIIALGIARRGFADALASMLEVSAKIAGFVEKLPGGQALMKATPFGALFGLDTAKEIQEMADGIRKGGEAFEAEARAAAATEQGLLGVTEASNKTVKATKALSEEAIKAEKAYQAWAATISKAGLQKEIDGLTKNLDRLAREGGELTAKAVEDLGRQFLEAEKNGAKLSGRAKEMRDAFLFTQVAVKGLSEALQRMSQSMMKPTALIEDIATGQAATAAAKLAEELSTGLGEIPGGLTEADKSALRFEQTLNRVADITFVIADAMHDLGLSGTSFGKAIEGIARGTAAGERIRQGMQTGGFQGAMMMGQGALAGVGAVKAATEAGSTRSRTLKGAATGAAMGMQVAGPWGAVVGAGVGALVGFFRGRAMDKLQKDIEKSVGVRVSEGLAKAIKEGAKAAKRSVGDQALLQLADVFTDKGGVAKMGLDAAGKSIMALQAGIAQGRIPAAEGIKSMGAAFAMLAAEAVKAEKVADKSLIAVIKNARALGQEVPEIKEFVKAQLQLATTGIGKVIGGIQIVDQATAQQQATLFSTTFWAVVKEQGLVDAVKAFGPIFENLRSQLEKIGVGVDLGGVERFFDIANQEKFIPLLEGVQGLNELLQGLSNSAYLTADAFTAIQGQAQTAFNQMIAAGLTEQDALLAIAPLLQNLVGAANAYGFELDANTQALIAQAQAAGIGFKTEPMERMVSVLELIAQKLGATASELAAIGVGAQGAAAGFRDMAAAAASVDVPEDGRMGGPIEAQHGFEGIVRGPTPFLAGEGGRPEYVSVRPMSGVSTTGGGRPGSVSVTAPISITIPISGVVTADPMEIARAIAEPVRLAVRDNLAGLASQIG